MLPSDYMAYYLYVSSPGSNASESDKPSDFMQRSHTIGENSVVFAVNPWNSIANP